MVITDEYFLHKLQLSTEKYHELMDDNFFEQEEEYLMQRCLINNFDNYTFTKENREKQIQRFHYLLYFTHLNVNHISYYGSFLSICPSNYFVQCFLQKKINVNLVFLNNDTIYSQLVNTLLLQKFSKKNIEKLNLLLKNGLIKNTNKIINYKDFHNLSQQKQKFIQDYLILE